MVICLTSLTFEGGAHNFSLSLDKHNQKYKTKKMKEELDMLFLLEHFSLEDLVKAEEEYINYEYKNTDNIAESYYDIEEYIDDECTETIMTRKYDTYIDDSWMNFSF